jgi:hypothetical protein
VKKRIVIKVVHDDGTYEFSAVEGREMGNGKLAPPPTKKMFAIIVKTIKALLAAPAYDPKVDAPKQKPKRQTRVRGSRS